MDAGPLSSNHQTPHSHTPSVQKMCVFALSWHSKLHATPQTHASQTKSTLDNCIYLCYCTAISMSIYHLGHMYLNYISSFDTMLANKLNR